jgi:hypothetical protein
LYVVCGNLRIGPEAESGEHRPELWQDALDFRPVGVVAQDGSQERFEHLVISPMLAALPPCGGIYLAKGSDSGAPLRDILAKARLNLLP